MGEHGTRLGLDSDGRAGRSTDGLKIVDYQPMFRESFRELNLAWIERDYGVEPADLTVLDHPEEHILAIGGEILMACVGETVVGTCALVPHGSQLELEKMTVAEELRGQGVGRRLLEAAVDRARSRGAATLRLDTSTKAKAAIHLYRSVGFRPMERAAPSPFARCDLAMELQLSHNSMP